MEQVVIQVAKHYKMMSDVMNSKRRLNMKKFLNAKLKKMMSAVVVCLIMGIVFVAASCGNNGKNGTIYQYEGDSFTDSYKLYDDNSYKREYTGTDYSNMALEVGTYETNGSSVNFYVESVTDVWPSGVYKYWFLSTSYSGSLYDDYLNISGRRYKKGGTTYSSK